MEIVLNRLVNCKVGFNGICLILIEFLACIKQLNWAVGLMREMTEIPTAICVVKMVFLKAHGRRNGIDFNLVSVLEA